MGQYSFLAKLIAAEAKSEIPALSHLTSWLRICLQQSLDSLH